MSNRHCFKKPLYRPVLAISAMLQLSVLGPLSTPAYADGAVPVQSDPSPAATMATATPIKHVVILVGENRTFDHVFATYRPKPGQTVQNLLSEGVVNVDGTPGPNYSRAEQYSSQDWMSDKFQLSPARKDRYEYLPPPQAGGKNPGSFSSLTDASSIEPNLESDGQQALVNSSGVTFTPGNDTRLYYDGHDVAHLPPGPFQWTNDQPGYGLAYPDYIADQTHAFYQEWQENDCDASHATTQNPSGCLADLFPWVEQTAGGKKGGRSMGFYNVSTGDAPYFKLLADQYTISDNYHQSMMGATGPNHLYLAYADTINLADDKGRAIPFAVYPDADATSTFRQNNNYSYTGLGATVTCSDTSEPGVQKIASYLHKLTPPIKPNCRDNYQYLILQVDPAYAPDGTNLNPKYNIPYKMVPVHQRSVAQALEEKGISWAFYQERWKSVSSAGSTVEAYGHPTNGVTFCASCDPFLYSSYVMESRTRRNAALRDIAQFANDVANNTLPAVSYIKPSGLIDGHPGNSTLSLFEGAAKYVVDTVKSNPALAQDTAIFITVDEGGGFYDSGYIQPLDFFGDGARLPMIVVSPYSQGGRVSHVYNDHASFVKFVEYNWGLKPLTQHSRDNLPNPTPGATPYVPGNSPAIGDLTDLFVFPPAPAAATN